jgi:protein O-GlcNAc transferase
LKIYRGQLQLAVELIQQSLELYPNNAAAHSNLGLALYALQRFDETLSSYDRALSVNPNNAEAYYNRGGVIDALAKRDIYR